MGKIDLRYVQRAEIKKAAEVKETHVEETKAEEESKEIFGETYEEFHNRLEREMEEARKAIRAMKELGF